MPLILNQVKPGDLITADDWNTFIDAFNLALARIEALEQSVPSGSDLSITQVLPAGPMRVGDVIRVAGTNFQFSIGATRVFFRGPLTNTQVFSLANSSTDTLLEFQVPNVVEATETGTVVSMEVTNQSESVTRQVIVRPRQVPLQGIAVLSWQDVAPSTFNPGDNPIFRYRIESRVNRRATWTLNPTISVAANSAEWNNRLSVLDEAGEVITSRQIVLDPLVPTQVSVRINEVPAGTDGVEFGLDLTATAAGVTGSSGVSTFTVGTAVEDPDPAIDLTLMPNPDGGTLAGSNLTVPAGGSAEFVVRGEFTVAATYDIALNLPSGATDWTVTPDIFTGTATTVTQAEINAGGGTATKFLTFSATPNPGAEERQLTIVLQRTGESRVGTVGLNLIEG